MVVTKTRKNARTNNEIFKEYNRYSARMLFMQKAKKLQKGPVEVVFNDGVRYRIYEYFPGKWGVEPGEGPPIKNPFSAENNIPSIFDFVVAPFIKLEEGVFVLEKNSWDADTDFKTSVYQVRCNGWNYCWNRYETEDAAKDRIKAEFAKALEEYIKKVKMDRGLFQERHFEWLVRRTINPTETAGDIAPSPTYEAEIKRQTIDLAKFIGIKIPRKGRGPTRAGSNKERTSKNSVKRKHR